MNMAKVVLSGMDLEERHQVNVITLKEPSHFRNVVRASELETENDPRSEEITDDDETKTNISIESKSSTDSTDIDMDAANVDRAVEYGLVQV